MHLRVFAAIPLRLVKALPMRGWRLRVEGHRSGEGGVIYEG